MPGNDHKKLRQSSPRAMYQFAKEYVTVGQDSLDAYRVRLPESQRHHTDVPFAIFYNFGHGIELGLKAYLLQNGLSIDALRSQEYGHNLESCLEKSLEFGLKDLCNLTDIDLDQVRLLSRTYYEKEFEYAVLGEVEIPHIDQIAAACDRLASGLGGLQWKKAEEHS